MTYEYFFLGCRIKEAGSSTEVRQSQFSSEESGPLHEWPSAGKSPVLMMWLIKRG